MISRATNREGGIANAFGGEPKGCLHTHTHVNQVPQNGITLEVERWMQWVGRDFPNETKKSSV